MQNFDKNRCYNKNGYIALISVLVSGAIISSIAVYMILFGLGEGRNSFSFEQSHQAKILVNTCVEEGLQQIKDSVNFSGSNNIIIGEGNCTYTVVDNGSQDREITATATVGQVVRKVRVVLNKINPEINVVSWEELADL